MVSTTGKKTQGEFHIERNISHEQRRFPCRSSNPRLCSITASCACTVTVVLTDPVSAVGQEMSAAVPVQCLDPQVGVLMPYLNVMQDPCTIEYAG